MENNKISLGQNGRKKYISRAFYRRNNRKKKTENAIPVATKKPQTLVWNYLTVPRSFLTNLKKNYKLNSSVPRANYVIITTTTKFRPLVLTGVGFKTISRFFACFKTFYTFFQRPLSQRPTIHVFTTSPLFTSPSGDSCILIYRFSHG